MNFTFFYLFSNLLFTLFFKKIIIVIDLEVDEDDVVEDGGVVGDVALEELYLGHGDELLLDEALVEAAYPRPLSPGPRLLRPWLFIL